MGHSTTLSGPASPSLWTGWWAGAPGILRDASPHPRPDLSKETSNTTELLKKYGLLFSFSSFFPTYRSYFSGELSWYQVMNHQPRSPPLPLPRCKHHPGERRQTPGCEHRSRYGCDRGHQPERATCCCNHICIWMSKWQFSRKLMWLLAR